MYLLRHTFCCFCICWVGSPLTLGVTIYGFISVSHLTFGHSGLASCLLLKRVDPSPRRPTAGWRPAEPAKLKSASANISSDHIRTTWELKYVPYIRGISMELTRSKCGRIEKVNCSTCASSYSSITLYSLERICYRSHDWLRSSCFAEIRQALVYIIEN